MKALRKKMEKENSSRATSVREKKDKEIRVLKQAQEQRLKKKEEEIKEAKKKLYECETKKPKGPPPLPPSVKPMMEAAPSYLFAKPVRRNKNYNNLRY